ncbi:MAG: isoprenylcysteine carboxylmethyltransferase family protein [Elusimicrobia bacterium]|nr:isoprenylcysteine carboxylmethyltransferase family protein [Elusimicrobiota bacterium]
MEFWVPNALVFLALAVELLSLNKRKGTVLRDAFSCEIATACFFLGYLFAFALRRHPPILGSWAISIGAVLAVSGIAFRYWAVRILGQYFTRVVQVSPDQKLVEAGPYRYIRHPSYSGSIATCLGVSLALRSLVSVGCMMALILAGLGYRMKVEERALEQSLGEPYRSYMRRTKRLIPFIW